MRRWFRFRSAVVDERDQATQELVDRSHERAVEHQRARDRIRDRLGERAAQVFDEEFTEKVFTPALIDTWRHQRAYWADAAWSSLLAGDIDGAMPHLRHALGLDGVLREVETSRDRYPLRRPLETAARKLGVDPDAVRALWVREPRLVSAVFEMGKIVEGARNSGLRRDPETMLAGLALAAQAEREGVAIHYAAQFIDVDEHGKRGRRARGQAALPGGHPRAGHATRLDRGRLKNPRSTQTDSVEPPWFSSARHFYS